MINNLPSRADIESYKKSDWDFTNKILYDMCAQNPTHNDPQIIIAKTLIIGRSYAAAIERGRDMSENLDSDFFYTIGVVKAFQNSNIDNLINDLRNKTLSVDILPQIIKVHHFVMELLRPITGSNKRSFSSKYLHFHLPKLFFIYDSRAASVIGYYTGKKSEWLNANTKQLTSLSENPHDEQYLTYFLKCMSLQDRINNEYNILLSLRQIDNLLMEKANIKQRFPTH